MSQTTSEEKKKGFAGWWSRITHRHDFSSWSYILWFVIVNLLAVMSLQWGVNETNGLADPLGFVFQIFQGKFMVINEFLLTGLVYFILIMLFNRFWLATQIFIDAVLVITVLEKSKILARSETIVPTDLGFLTGGRFDNLTSWVPNGIGPIVVGALLVMIATTAIFLIVGHRDTRKGVIYTRVSLIRWLVRLVCVAVSTSFLVSFVLSMSSIGTWANNFATALGDSPKLWDSKIDAQANGAAVAFARLVKPKIMDEPANYSEETMKEIASRYAQTATSINARRANSVTNSTVIFLLSESFSDPSRVPGIELNKDIMPNIREIKNNTTSGLMLSAGYGGGTANMEYMALTGLSMLNFAPSLSSPYQQLVQSQVWSPTFNQLWNTENSYAFHPYYSNMYSRNVNYQKFGFSHFWTLDGPEFITPTDSLGSSPYVSDESTYTAVLNSLKNDQAGQNYFYQVITMQNHMPYQNYYDDNEVKVKSTTDKQLSNSETLAIETYAKGAEYTDGYTQDFLNQLDELDQPITVVFYGDHLPGVYTTAGKNLDNSVALHETDYFIWSNKASGIDNQAAGQSATNSAYTSPNFFQAQLSEHMNAKVSPYVAFLTALHTKVPAMEPAVVNHIQGWDRIPDGQALYLDNEGNYLDVSQADDQTKQLLEDYKLIQYDITAGNQYLKDLGFMTIS
ncbi:LTA synthase family protein [Alloscardovia criceti]|uniref:LTA synthase family protein n=1 Tax=Alloscardovia criceti TaxID=356828 RepID=UPI0003705264|nr:alkaline phosphatase family protein [Alloscardovia criceti]